MTYHCVLISRLKLCGFKMQSCQCRIDDMMGKSEIYSVSGADRGE